MIRIILIALLICISVTLPAKDKNLTINKNKVELIITEKTTIAQLKKIQKTLKEERNIDFTFKNIIVNSKKQLSKITIEVDTNDGVKNSGTLMISNIYNVGFIRDYTPQSTTPLLIGNLSEKEIKLK